MAAPLEKHLPSDPASGPRTAGFIQGIVLLLPITLAVMGIAVLVPVIPQLMARFAAVPGHEYLIQGGVLTAPALCVAILSPFAGWLADRLGRRRLLIFSMLVYALVGVAPLVLENLYAIIVSRVAVGACEALIMTISTTMIGDFFVSPARERWLANQTAVASLSSLALIPLGGALARLYGWRGPFMVYSFSVVLAILVWLLTWEVGGARGPESSPRERSHTSQEAAAALPWRKLTGICVITLFASVMFYTIQTQSGLALSQLRVRDPAVLGLLTTFASLGVPADTLLFRSLARLPVGYLLAGEFVLIGLGFAWMGKSTEPHLFVLAAACNQLGCGMVLPTLLTWAARGLQYEVRGRGIGIWTGTFSVGQFLSGVLVTLLASAAGGVLPAFVVLGAMSLVAALLALGAQLYQRAPATTSASHS